MHRDDVRESLEIRAVEGEQVSDLMYFQHSGEVRVVDLNATHFVGLEQSQPD